MLEELKKIICDFVDIDPDTITEDSVLRTDLGLNSFDLVNVAVAVESRYNVSISDKRINSIKTVGDIINLVESEK
ncbi:MAG: acyl carrier protein [Clostridia bacterium]|nr:acyl carrier protein [Clostridia bacterium]